MNIKKAFYHMIFLFFGSSFLVNGMETAAELAAIARQAAMQEEQKLKKREEELKSSGKQEEGLKTSGQRDAELKTSGQKVFGMFSSSKTTTPRHEVDTAAKQAEDMNSSGQKKKVGFSMPMPSMPGSKGSPRSNSPHDSLDKATPRNFNELSAMVLQKAKSTKADQFIALATARKRSSSSGEMVGAEQEVSTDTSDKQLKMLIEELKQEIVINPELMAEAALRAHNICTKQPLNAEKEGYTNFQKKREEEYENMKDALLLRILTTEYLKEENAGPSQEIAYTHATVLRKSVKNKEKWLFFFQGFSGVMTLLATGATIWGAYAQAHPGSSSCGNSTVG